MIRHIIVRSRLFRSFIPFPPTARTPSGACLRPYRIAPRIQSDYGACLKSQVRQKSFCAAQEPAHKLCHGRGSHVDRNGVSRMGCNLLRQDSWQGTLSRWLFCQICGVVPVLVSYIHRGKLSGSPRMFLITNSSRTIAASFAVLCRPK